MSSFLTQILADPDTGESLEPINYEYYLNNTTGAKFPIVNGVANLLTGSHVTQQQPALHEAANSQFDYRDHYEKDAVLVDYFEEDEALVTRNERNRNRQAVMNEVPASVKTILDVGCGGAWVAGEFVPKGVNVISMDISSVNPTGAKQKYPQPNHEAIIADAMHLPFKNESIDCIIASEIIEHVPNPSLFINSLLNKLKTGGVLILMTPYNEKIRYHLCVHCNRPTPQNAHLHSFTESSIRTFIPRSVYTRTDAICNNYFLKLRLYNLLSFLPYGAWKLVDNFANSIARKPLHLLTVITKNG